MRPRLLLPLPLLAVLAGCSPSGEAEAATLRPNVVVIVIDTLRADRLGAYGYRRNTSPVLDRLAREGLLAEDVTAQASWTLPSMVSLFQGRYLTAYRDAYLEDAPTLAEVFREAGYRTLGVVGNGLLSSESGFDRGFDHYDSRKRSTDGARTSAAREAGELFQAARGPMLAALAREEGRPAPPVFAYLHFMDPHGPYAQHDAYMAELPTDPEHSGHALERQRLQYAEAWRDRSLEPAVWNLWREMSQDLGRYDQEVRYADEYVGRVIELLSDSGAIGNTIVAVVADHGEGLFDHPCPAGPDLPARPAPDRFFFKEHGKVLYRELIGTPMILWGPGIPSGLRLKEPVENIDLFPTLLDLAGIPAPDGLHGRTLGPALDGTSLPPRAVYSSILEERSARDQTGRWKLIEPTELSPLRETRLYDLAQDPGELENLAPQNAELVADLRKALQAWVAENPTVSNLGRGKSQAAQRDMEELGYAGKD